MPVPKETLEEIALSEREYELIVQRLGREPNNLELGMFGALWSEHCGYKHSKPLLKIFPTTSRRVLTSVGEENAGVVDIGDGLAIVMKMESHNHPSAVEPFQGAATGIGGIVRDIFTMGARPIALLNSLRFGPLGQPRNRYLFNGVIAGIASYGNCLGIPNVGGEIYFSPSYSANPLVNVMCVGIAPKDRIIKARASGAGNLLMLVGADTGRDGLHGASGLASRTFEGQPEMRSAVQVGNPFLEKLLIEACLELAHTDWIVGIQDLGAAGLTSASIESAARAGKGVEIDVLKVPRREERMTPYDVMLSESQERMLLIVKKGQEDKVKALFDRWDLHSDVIGYVTEDGMARVKEGARMVAEVPASLLTQPPLYHFTPRKPSWLRQLQRFDLAALPDLSRQQAGSTLLQLLSSPTIASKKWVYRQYDHQVQTNTVVPPGEDAAVLRIKGTNRAIALATDGNGRWCYLNPRTGGAMAVAEAARNIVCSGAEPIAITDCLNFGDPERPDVYYQLKECIAGMAKACRALSIPVISGNVSLYNETKDKVIYPTPIVGMLGLMEDVNTHCTTSFKEEGDLVYLLGRADSSDISAEYVTIRSKEEFLLQEPEIRGLAGSEYLEAAHGIVAGNPHLDLELEERVQRFCHYLIRNKAIHSAHDCSEGGVAVALAESCLAGSLGFRGDSWHLSGRIDAALFGELPSRILVSVAPALSRGLEEMALDYRVPLRRLGRVVGKRLTIPGLLDLPLKRLSAAWSMGLERALSSGG